MRGNCAAVLLAAVTTPARDDYGDPVAAPGTPADVALERCAKAPRSSEERRSPNAPAVITGLTLYVPGDQGSAIGPSSRIEVDGIVYVVEGDPGEWRSPFTGSLKGYEVALKTWEQP